MAAPLTFAYIVEPPDYQFFACSLLASIRTHFPPEVSAVGYCPAHRLDEIHPAVFRAHEIMGSEIRPMRTEGMWDTPYPHGNKILAAMEPRDSTFSAFVDSDVLFLRPNRAETIAADGHVACSPAASLVWADDDIWDTIYGAFGMEVPGDRIRLMRRSGRPRVPYYSAGLVVFPEEHSGGGRFPDVWYETARTIDRIEALEKRRPYLDQMSLPVAIRRAGLNWRELPEEQHFILGGRLRGDPLPDDREIFTVHYRNREILKETGLLAAARKMLKAQTGTRHVRRLAPESG